MLRGPNSTPVNLKPLLEPESPCRFAGMKRRLEILTGYFVVFRKRFRALHDRYTESRERSKAPPMDPNIRPKGRIAPKLSLWARLANFKATVRKRLIVNQGKTSGR